MSMNKIPMEIGASLRYMIITALTLILSLWLLVFTGFCEGQDKTPAHAHKLPAFPGAEGLGKWATGGRDGDIYHVINLNDSGSGSLRYGLETANGPRTTVFDVGGIIELKRGLSIGSQITLAGETAPGDGICIIHHGAVVAGAHDVIIRHLRFRPGDARLGDFTGDALSIHSSQDVIIDHCSTSWGVDENLSLAGEFSDITVQYCIIAEGLHRTEYYHGEHIPEHQGHSMGSLIKPHRGDGTASFHHNLWACNGNRNPAVGTYTNDQKLWADIRNNVVYNCLKNGYSSGDSNAIYMNYVGNYIIAGPATMKSWLPKAFRARPENNVHIYQMDNRIDADMNKTRDGLDTGWEMFEGTYTRLSSPVDTKLVTTHDAVDAYQLVLENTGAMPGNRDPVDQRIISCVANGTGKIIDSQNEVGSYPQFSEVHRPAGWDSDGDGMPDHWEKSYPGLDSSIADSDGDLDGDGYTNLEEYLHYMAALSLNKY
ncbi:polysaccharide lyase family 1 protein [Candidatus Poribacteria bacterium]